MDELDPELSRAVDVRYRRTVRTYFLFILVSAATAVAGSMMVPPVSSAATTVTMPIWVLVFFLAVSAIVARRFLTRWERLRDIKLLRGFEGLLSALQFNIIAISAMSLLIVVAGVASGIYSADRGDVFRSVVISLIVFALNFPRLSTWKTIASNLKDV